MPALERVAAVRVVATPGALDTARWAGDDVKVIRIAPDEALGLGATAVELADDDAIVEREAGYAVALLGRDELARVASHVEWELPEASGTLAQGKIAGVPAKLVTGEPALLVVQSAYLDELRGRLGW